MENFDKVKDIIVDRLGVDADKEDEFGTEIPDEEAEKINTVGDAVKFINSIEK